MPVRNWRGDRALKGQIRNNKLREFHLNILLGQAHLSVAGLLFPKKVVSDEDLIRFEEVLKKEDDSIFDNPLNPADVLEE
ncbi:hypothetical protein HDU96_000346 [Phlyctochytrium bullatum]|nr:hypothetical protein HDU96_000346 [Phlyctochytrium bullatum]